MEGKGEPLGERIKRLREKAGLDQVGLARLAGLPLNTVKNYEQNRRQPRLDAAGRIARAVGVTLDVLAGVEAATEGERPSVVESAVLAQTRAVVEGADQVLEQLREDSQRLQQLVRQLRQAAVMLECQATR